MAIVGFATVTVLVLSGLTWATVVSLRLERATRKTHANQRQAEAKKDLHNRLEIARLRVDREVLQVLNSEASRAYDEYEPRGNHLEAHTENGTTAEDTPPRMGNTASWIALHFQVTEELCWTSPQLALAKPPVGETHLLHVAVAKDGSRFPTGRITCVEADDSDPLAVERKDLLDQLALEYTPELFAERIATAWNASTSELAGGTGQGRVGGVCDGAYGRLSHVVRLQRPFLPRPLECESRRQVLKATGRHPLVHVEDTVEVRVNEMVPIILPLPGHTIPTLAFIRRVDIGNERVFQGFIVDLAQLADVVRHQVRDLFEQVELELALDAEHFDKPSTRLVALPLRLVVPHSGTISLPPNTSSVRATVIFAWGIAAIALVAIGLGVKRLVSLAERRREFTYAVTHELRTPLTTFQLYTDLLSAGLVPKEKKAFYLDTLNRESRRLAGLVSEVLEFSRVESDAVHAQMRNHPVSALTDAVRERYEARCKAVSMSLCIDADEADEQALYTDPQIALQIIGTLIDNACKYAAGPSHPTPPDEQGEEARVPSTIQLRVLEPRGGKLAIEVADDGPGIPLVDRRDLFKPFHRGSGRITSPAGGVGLGLALAKRWSRLIHANLELVDQPGERGACFRLTLPAGGRSSC